MKLSVTPDPDLIPPDVPVAQTNFSLYEPKDYNFPEFNTAITDSDYIEERLQEIAVRYSPKPVFPGFGLLEQGFGFYNTLEIEFDLRLVQELIAIQGLRSTGNWKTDYDLWWCYKILKEIEFLRQGDCRK